MSNTANSNLTPTLHSKPPNDGLGCALLIIAACVGAAFLIWAEQGFPGLAH